MPFTNAAYSSGISCMGQLIQLSEGEVFKRLPVSQKLENKIKNKILEYDLCFGMTAPGWEVPTGPPLYWSLGPTAH